MNALTLTVINFQNDIKIILLIKNGKTYMNIY